MKESEYIKRKASKQCSIVFTVLSHIYFLLFVKKKVCQNISLFLTIGSSASKAMCSRLAFHS